MRFRNLSKSYIDDSNEKQSLKQIHNAITSLSIELNKKLIKRYLTDLHIPFTEYQVSSYSVLVQEAGID